MKHIKSYEHNAQELKNKPQIGDYVIIYLKSFEEEPDEKDYYIKTHLGIIVDIDPKSGKGYHPYEIKYEDNIWEIGDNVTPRDILCVNREEIQHWSKNKEYLEHIIKATKYNL